MMTKSHCECDTKWITGLTCTIFDYRNIVSPHIRKRCQECNMHPWYDAYDENEARDLKWMNN